MRSRLFHSVAVVLGCVACEVMAQDGKAGFPRGSITPSYSPAQQTAVASPGLQAAADRLLAANPRVQFLRQGSLITRVYGPAFGSGNSPEETAAAFAAAYADLFGAEANELAPVSRLPDARHTQPLMYNPQTGTYKFTLVYYSQFRSGLPVFRSDLRLLVRNEPNYPLVLAANSLRDLGDF